MRINPLNITIDGCHMKVMLTDISKFEITHFENDGYHTRGYSMNSVVDDSQNLEKISDPIFRIIVSTLAMLRIQKSVGGLNIRIKKYDSPIPFEEILPSLIIKAYEKFYEFEL